MFQAERILLASRLKDSGSETNDKHGHKLHCLRQYIVEGGWSSYMEDQIPRINLVFFAHWGMTNINLSIL